MELRKEHHNCSILYVDDEEKSLKYFKRAFEDRFMIFSADNAAEGSRLLVDHHDEIGVLVTDQRMPGEKGIEFLQQARQLYPDTVRILTSAYSDFDVIIEAINSSSIFKYVTKPWDIRYFESVLDDACQFYLQKREHQERAPDRRPLQSQAVTSHSDSDIRYLQTLDDVARYLNVDKFTVYRLVTRNKLPAFKVGNQWRFKQELIDAWLEDRSNVSRNKPV